AFSLALLSQLQALRGQRHDVRLPVDVDLALEHFVQLRHVDLRFLAALVAAIARDAHGDCDRPGGNAKEAWIDTSSLVCETTRGTWVPGKSLQAIRPRRIAADQGQSDPFLANSDRSW